MTAIDSNDDGTEQCNGYTCVICGTSHTDLESVLQCCNDLLESESHVGSTDEEVRQAVRDIEVSHDW